MQTHSQVKKRIPGMQPGTRSEETDAAANHTMDENNYTSILNKPRALTIKEQIAHWWLKRDFQVLPVQPNSKKLVAGFGFYQDKIATPERVSQWFGEKSQANIAVCGTQTSFIVDFDDPGLYKFWAGKFPAEARTYTERTPRGGYHVFARAWPGSLKGFIAVNGVELKHTAMVYPSLIGCTSYARGEGDLLQLDPDIVLAPLRQAPTVEKGPPARTHNAGALQKIKSAYSCLELIRSVNPNVKVYGPSKRFISVACPFHDDRDPSCWIDIERNLWGCHACAIRGDVINLYARLKGITNSAAIQEMGKAL